MDKPLFPTLSNWDIQKLLFTQRCFEQGSIFSICSGIRQLTEECTTLRYNERNKHTCRWIISRFALALFTSSSIFSESFIFLFSLKASLILLMAYVLNTNNKTTCIHRCVAAYDISTFFKTCRLFKKSIHTHTYIFCPVLYIYLIIQGLILPELQQWPDSLTKKPVVLLEVIVEKCHISGYQSSPYCLLLL